MTEINVGDRVQWTERHPSRPYLHTERGTVQNVGYASALVYFDGYWRGLPLAVLTKVSPFEEIAEDYAFALRHCGDLGGVELV